ncbi:GNAT family N-acetyltransferase [Oceanobacillus manasiensis]|uniref:GNAT family N-acetyltransferase n=1 Tax=Oceanobacillus manasiensis TaxID=586413 RepID=UPI0005A9A951|nr:GNAT family N-acetyltransferase [Oceanobacillus manasiensis]
MFKTERCYINSFKETDFADVQKLFVNQDVRKYLGGIRDEESIIGQLQSMLNPSDSAFYWVIREKQTDNFIGLVSLDPHHEGAFLEVSYQFLPVWWGKGYATESVLPIIQFAFNNLNQKKLLAETQTANKGSCRLLEKLGMQLERKTIRFGAEQSIYSIKPYQNIEF